MPTNLPHFNQKIRSRYIRLPNHTMEHWHELVFKSNRVIVWRSHITSAHLIFDGKIVLAPCFEMVYFEFLGKWFAIGKIRNLQGEHTGYYCDIVTPPRLLDDGVELTDLFLDLWVSPDLRYKILDKDELEKALQERWIASELYEKAKKELQKLIRRVEDGRFPPSLAKDLERRLHL